MRRIPTTLTELGRIKDRAKVLRPGFQRLGHARDAAAKEAGYEDYHHAHWCALHQKHASPGRDDEYAGLAALAIANLPLMVRCDPSIDLDAPRFQRWLARSAGLKQLRDEILLVQIAGGHEYFRAAVHDAGAHLRLAGFSPSREFHHGEQLRAADRFWSEVLKPENASAYHLLCASSLFKVMAGYLAHLQRERERASASVNLETQKLYDIASTLLDAADDDEALAMLDVLSEELMPRAMNVSIHTGEEDYEKPSTYWSRISATVSLEMAGTVSLLPFGLLQQKLDADSSEPLQFFTTSVPDDLHMRRRYVQAARKRWERVTGRR